MSDVICLGELIVDFVSATQDASISEAKSFVPAAGGAPANVAVGVVRQGYSAAYIGKVGNDAFGQFMYDTMVSQGVDASGIAFDNYARTTLNFNARRADGVRECLFYRNPGADMMLKPDDIDESLFKGASVFHFGSISLSSPDYRDATLKALDYAEKYGLLRSYDPNLRLGLWTYDEDEIRNTVCSVFNRVDFVKISDDESEFILGTSVPEEIAQKLVSYGVKLVAVTLGSKGCYYSDGHTDGYFPAFNDNIMMVDTTGAGDSFTASMICHLADRKMNNLSLAADHEYAARCEYANRAGALATTKIGAIPSLPTKAEILATY